MASLANAFTVKETHGILLRASSEVRVSSDPLGWRSSYASIQRETPYEDYFGAVDDHLIILHLDGPVPVRRFFHNREASRLIPAGGMFMMPGGMDFGVRLGGILNTLHLYVRRAVIEEVAAEIVPGDPAKVQLLPRFGEGDPLVERLLMAIRAALEERDPSATPYVDYLVRAVAARLVRCHSSATPARMPRAVDVRVDRKRVADAIGFMEENLDRSIQLDSIAAAAGLSASHLARQFRETTGLAPHRYLMNLRIERAKRLLAETSDPVAEVALACGFANQEHLTRLFKRSTGTTPAAYRTSRRN